MEVIVAQAFRMCKFAPEAASSGVAMFFIG